MEIENDDSFHVRPEVAALYDISFILCGLFFCKRCQAEPPVDSSEALCSNRYYYRIAELAFDSGWRAEAAVEYSTLCPVCVAQQTIPADRPKTGSG
jgi:hypothetical protein